MTDINELAGQELREAIALAKGWEYREDRAANFWRTPDGRDVHPGFMPQWDTSFAAAFGLIASIDFEIIGSHSAYSVELTQESDSGHSLWGASADTLPVAICRAWLAMKQAEAVTT